MFRHQSAVRVRYSETDQMGFVYYGQYASYFEVARVEALRSLGCTYNVLEKSGILMPVTEYSIKYHKPALYDDELVIETSINELPSARIRFAYNTYNASGSHLNTAFTELVFLNKETMRPVKSPLSLREALLPYFHGI